MTRPHSAWIILIALLALLRSWTTVPQAIAAQDFKLPPYPLRVVGGGNCVWLAWEMAWLRWGFILPVGGHACQWTRLDGVQLQQGGRTGTLAIVDQPIADSIMIIPPTKELQSQIFGGYGHLAWVKKVHPQRVVVIESSIFPKQPGQRWQGCWCQQSEYALSNLENARFLCLTEVLPVENALTVSAHAASLSSFSHDSTLHENNQPTWQSCRDMWSYTLLSMKLLCLQ